VRILYRNATAAHERAEASRIQPKPQVENTGRGLMPDWAGSYCKEFVLLTYQQLMSLAGQVKKRRGDVRKKINISMG
jgi:hypothetical protein